MRFAPRNYRGNIDWPKVGNSTAIWVTLVIAAFLIGFLGSLGYLQ